MKLLMRLAVCTMMISVLFTFVSCTESSEVPGNDPLGLNEIQRGFFRTGKAIYSVSDEGVSHFSLSKKLAIRIMSKSGVNTETVYGLMAFSGITDQKISFTFQHFTSESSSTTREYSISSGESIDLNGDEEWDIAWRKAPETTFVERRDLKDAMFLVFNKSENSIASFNPILNERQDPSRLFFITTDNKVFFNINEIKDCDPETETVTIPADEFCVSVEKGDFLIVGNDRNPGLEKNIFNFKKIRNFDNSGDDLNLHLSDLSNDDYRQLYEGMKYHIEYGENPDEPYLINRDTQEIVIWNGKIDHTSNIGDSSVRIYSPEKLKITLTYFDFDFDIGLENELVRFFYHPIYRIEGSIKVEADTEAQSIPVNTIIAESISVKDFLLPFDSLFHIGFSMGSNGEGNIEADVQYDLNDTFYSVKINSSSWESSDNWLPHADFRTTLRISEATAAKREVESEAMINPALHISSGLSFLDIFRIPYSDLNIGLKLKAGNDKGESHLDAIPWFSVDSQYSIYFNGDKKYTFPKKKIYAVDLYNYIIY